MIATEIGYKGKALFVSTKSLANKEIKKIWVLEDERLTKMVKRSEKSFMFKKTEIKSKLGRS